MFLHETCTNETYLECLTYIKQNLFTNTELKHFQPLKICTDGDKALLKSIS